MRLFSIVAAISLFVMPAQAGTSRDPKEQHSSVQPTIMVIPFTPKGESLRKNLESDEHLRVAITKVKEGFDNRGINTIDLRAKLKQLSNIDALEADAVDDIKNQVIELSGADVYIEVESKINRSNTGNSVTIVVTAFDAFNGQSLANKVSTSPSFYTEKFDKLIEKAVDNVIEDFLNTIQSKFDLIVENGRSIVLNVSIAEGSEIDLDSEFDKDLLSDLIEFWVEENAYNNYYHLQGMTTSKMIFDDIKIPLLDPETGNTYRVTHFAAKFRRYLRELDLEVERVVQGSNLVFILKQ